LLWFQGNFVNHSIIQMSEQTVFQHAGESCR
jgi:hypothetical protein